MEAIFEAGKDRNSLLMLGEPKGMEKRTGQPFGEASKPLFSPSLVPCTPAAVFLCVPGFVMQPRIFPMEVIRLFITAA